VLRRALLALPALAGCFFGNATGDRGDDGGDDGTFPPQDAGDLQRCGPGNAPLDAMELEIDGNIARVRVGFGGGCETHEFRVWGFINTYSLSIQHDGNNDACEAYITQDIFIDLSTLPGDAATVNVSESYANQSLGSAQWTRSATTTPPAGVSVLPIGDCGVVGP
jgi:hypothetical protein